MASDEGIREWLDRIKPGFGARFGSAFDEVGIEDESDLKDMDGELLESLETELKTAGAKAMQLKKIRAAVEAILNESSTEKEKLTAAKAELLSHSTADAAASMPAGVLKVSRQKQISAPSLWRSPALISPPKLPGHRVAEEKREEVRLLHFSPQKRRRHGGAFHQGRTGTPAVDALLPRQR